MARDKNAQERIETLCYTYGTQSSGCLAEEIYDDEVAPLENLVYSLNEEVASLNNIINSLLEDKVYE